jgi:hypothetical protein
VAFHQLPLLDPLDDDDPSPPRVTLLTDTFFPDTVTTFVESRGTVVVPPATVWPTDPVPP